MKKTSLLAACLCLPVLTASVHAQETKAWIDVTSEYVENPGFDSNSAYGWLWESDASSQTVRVECMEFWNGTFNFWQNIEGAPEGKYRMSVQAFDRTGGNENSYNDHSNGSENITANMYANDKKKKLVSVYSYEFPDYVDGCWTHTTGGGGGWPWWGGWGEIVENASVLLRTYP